MRRNHAALVILLPMLALAVGGCTRAGGGEGIASAGRGGPAGANADANQAADDPQERARQFVACMRAEGIDLPDPEPAGPGEKGGVRIEAGDESSVDKQRMVAATEKCRQYLPEGRERGQLSPEQLERERAFAQCMRDNGVPDVPDPDPEGGFAAPRAEIDKGSSAFRDALEKCNQHLGGDRVVK